MHICNFVHTCCFLKRPSLEVSYISYASYAAHSTLYYCVPQVSNVTMSNTSLSPYDNQTCVMRYMSTVFTNSHLLVTAMAKTGTIITGIKALNYFDKDAKANIHTWDFMCSGSDQHMMYTMSVALTMSGVEWDSNDTASDIRDMIMIGEVPYMDGKYVLRGTIRVDGENQVVMLGLLYDLRPAAYSGVLDATISMFRCMLTPLYAIHFDYGRTKDRQCISYVSPYDDSANNVLMYKDSTNSDWKPRDLGWDIHYVPEFPPVFLTILSDRVAFISYRNMWENFCSDTSGGMSRDLALICITEEYSLRDLAWAYTHDHHTLVTSLGIGNKLDWRSHIDMILPCDK